MLTENQRYTLNKIDHRNCATLDGRAIKALEKRGYIALYGIRATFNYSYVITSKGKEVLEAVKRGEK